MSGGADEQLFSGYSCEKTYSKNIDKPLEFMVPKNTKGNFIDSVLKG
jgi:hypothetical protein